MELFGKRGLRLGLRERYALGISALLLLVFGAFAWVFHLQLKDWFIVQTHAQTRAVMGQIEAAREYVKDVLRPKMYSLVPPDAFIVEAMSTSYVTREIMERFGRWNPGYRYKRATLNPRNPVNRASPFEERMIRDFQQHPQRTTWSGIVSIEGNSFFVRMHPIRMEKGCLRCHGDPKDAPAELLERYGPQGGFGRKLGEIAGLDTLYIPVDVALSRIRASTLGLFLIGLGMLLVLALGVNLLFHHQVISPLRTMLAHFKAVAEGREELGKPLVIGRGDELEELAHGFNQMAHQIQRAHGQLSSYAETLEELVEERTRLLHETTAAKEMLQAVFDGISDPLALMDPRGKVTMMNRAFLQEARIRSGKEGLPCHRVRFDRDRPCEGCPLYETEELQGPTSLELKGPDGEDYELHFYPIRDEEGVLKEIVYYCRKITQQKAMERQLLLADKLSALGQLSAGVAHEVNNPLGVILCYTNLLKRQLKGHEQALEDLAVIERHAIHCKEIVESLLHFARTTETRRRPTRIEEVIQEVLSVLEPTFSKASVEVTRSFDPAVPELVIDPEKMRQVFMNLLLNAQQAMDGTGGRIHIQTTLASRERFVELRIQDSGRGIPFHVLPRIFDPFFTTKPPGQGTGLGLSVCYRIMEEHGGRIQVEETGPNGTTFVLTFPIEEVSLEGSDPDRR